ncbi:MAG: hypothetical protein QM831_40685 [Kofleriaceae bacterium]
MLRIATCVELPEPDADAIPLADALDRAGIAHRLVAWDDPDADWSTPEPTIIRSTWNYPLAIDRFTAWLDRVQGPIWNPREIVRTNVYKRYLLDLAARGVAIVPTTLVERGQPIEVPREKVVVKPEVGAGSLNTRVFEAGDREALAHRATIDGAALIQPYIASVDEYGERSIILIDGELSHAIRKAPRFAGQTENITGPFPISDDERALALAAFAPYPGLLYGRCDMARDAQNRPMVMELELVEPSLFFWKHPPAADRYVAALARRLSSLIA